MKNERTVYTTRGCFPFILFSSCNRKNENGYNGSYFYFSFFVWGLEKRKRMLSYPFSIFYYEIEKRKTKGRYIHGPGTHCFALCCVNYEIKPNDIEKDSFKLLHCGNHTIVCCKKINSDGYGLIDHMGTLSSEAGISGRDKQQHPTVFCGMQLLIPAWDTCFWWQSPHISTKIS